MAHFMLLRLGAIGVAANLLVGHVLRKFASRAQRRAADPATASAEDTYQGSATMRREGSSSGAAGGTQSAAGTLNIDVDCCRDNKTSVMPGVDSLSEQAGTSAPSSRGSTLDEEPRTNGKHHDEPCCSPLDEPCCSPCDEPSPLGSPLVPLDPKQSRNWIDSAKANIHSWHFDVFELAKMTHGNPLFTTVMTLMEEYDLLDGWKLNRKTVETFLQQVESLYLPQPYHNNTHAADVTQTAAVIMKSFAKKVESIPKLEQFCVIIAASVHDLGHLGVNNDFLISSKHPRATTYNDRSVNENFHISQAFTIARCYKGCNIFENFTIEEQKKIRKLLIDTIMTTDMAVHFDLVKNFDLLLEATPDVADWADRGMLYQMMVHLADIANPSRPFHLARGWAERVIQEFCNQGDMEAELGLPVSAFCNRANMNMPKAQQGFIAVFLTPTLAVYEKVAPCFVAMSQHYLAITISEWKRLEEEGLKL